MELASVTAVLTQHADLFIRAYVHGSTARGGQDAWSDVDLVLVRRTELPFFDRIREVFDFFFELRRPEIMIYTEEEIRELVDTRGSAFLQDVVAKGVLIEGTQDRSTPVAAPGRE